MYDESGDSLAVHEPESIDEFLSEFIACQYFVHGASGSAPSVSNLCHHAAKLYTGTETCAAHVRKCVSARCFAQVYYRNSRARFIYELKSRIFSLIKVVFSTRVHSGTYTLHFKVKINILLISL